MKLYILLDKSGSMAANWEEAVGSLNTYARELIGKKGFKKADITVVAFDKQSSIFNPDGPLRARDKIDFKVLRNHVPLKDWTDIMPDEAHPRAMTPLRDAIGMLAEIVNEDKPKKAAITIITDGLENASIEFSHDAVRKIISDWKESFDVNFIGADFDSFAQAQSFGVVAGSTLNMTKGNYRGATMALARKSTDYSAGVLRDFTEEERSVAAGNS